MVHRLNKLTNRLRNQFKLPKAYTFIFIKNMPAAQTVVADPSNATPPIRKIPPFSKIAAISKQTKQF